MREFLKGLGIDSVTVNKIMREYGKNVTKYREDIKGYQDKINSYETDIKKLNSQAQSDDKIKESLQKLKDENTDLTAQLQMSGANVKKEFSKFVKNEVLAMVDDKTDFSTALTNYKNDNPQYFGKEEQVVYKTSSSPNLAGDSQPQTTNGIMNDIIRNSI